MSLSTEQLYELLPAIYRARDSEIGEPLKALVAVIAEQALVMEADIARLYENWFIETCDEWVVPYIGDLLAVRGLHSLGADAPFSQRALVANTLSYRRSKGTATMLEQLARDTTGWNARAAEFFELLETTQYYNHIRPANARTPDLRRTNELELVDTAFDTAAHTADVRRIARGRGWYNIPNVGLFVWRLQSYFVQRSSARAAAGPADGRYTFSPLKQSAPLFNRPQTETAITHLVEEINVPGLLRRRPLYDELETRRQMLIDGDVPTAVYFGVKPVLQVFVRINPGDAFIEVAPEEILICNLTEPPAAPNVWLRPPTTKLYQPRAGGAKQPRSIKVAVDPARGRLAFPTGVVPADVNVSYAYGFSGDVGGGPYNRRESVEALLAGKVSWQVGVSKEVAPVPGKIVATITEAITLWNLQPAGSTGVIAIMDSATYAENITGVNRILIPKGSQLLIVAADWPKVPVPGGAPGVKERIAGDIAPDSRRPHLLGNIAAAGTASGERPGQLALNGLLVEGSLTIEDGNLGASSVSHCTLVPEKGGLSVASKNGQLKITITRSICGPIGLPDPVPFLRVEESIVDGAGGAAIAASGTAVEVEKSTVFGTTSALRIEAGNSIFTGVLQVIRQQAGCVRFSHVPDGSKTPRRFRCQPDLALKNVQSADKQAVIVRLVPSFTSEDFGNHGYGQLRPGCAEELCTGAEDGSEMGVFSFLKQPQRATNLQTGLDEYLRFGLEAGVIFVT